MLKVRITSFDKVHSARNCPERKSAFGNQSPERIELRKIIEAFSTLEPGIDR